MTAAEATAAHRSGLEAAARLEPELARRYTSVLRENARHIAAAYRRKAEVLLAAVQPTPPPHAHPTLAEILNETALLLAARTRTQVLRRRLALAAAAPLLGEQPDRAFYQPLVDKQAGKQAERIIAGVRETAAGVISDAFGNGWSIDETARELHTQLGLDAEWRGQMLARTDVVSIANAASQQAAAALGDEGPGFKRWLTAEDDRVRPTHVEAQGQTVGRDEPFSVGGEHLMYPGDPSASDEETMNCRCAVVYLDSPDAELAHSDEGGIRDEMPLAAAAAPRSTLKPEMEEESMDFSAWEYEALIAASFSTAERKQLASKGFAMPDGSYPIRNADDLDKAIKAVGRGNAPHDAIRRHIIKRAKALGLSERLPDNWSSGGGMNAAGLLADANGLWDMLIAALEGAASATAAQANAIDAASTIAEACRASYDQRPMMASGEEAEADGDDDADAPFLTADARGQLPFPREWFFRPEEDKPTALTVTADGQVFGHLAEWDRCHTGFQNRCVLAPRSPSQYEAFHVGQVITADGEPLNVGKITVATGHADPFMDSASMRAGGVQAHYDNTGAVAAYVRVTDGEIGPWISGSIEPEASNRQIRDLMANGPSGDWRNITRRAGGLDLLGILSVPKQGFPVPRAMVASGEDGEELVLWLLAGGVEPCEYEDRDENELWADEAGLEREHRLAVMPAVR